MCPQFLVDTCIWSHLSKERSDPLVAEWLDRTAGLAIPVAAVIEIQKGILERPSGRNALDLMTWFERLVAGRITVLNTGLEAGRLYGAMLARRELKTLWCQDAASQTVRGSQDLHIAATAIVHGLPVATSNIRHFRMIDRCFSLPGLYDPATDTWHVEPAALRFSPVLNIESCRGAVDV